MTDTKSTAAPIKLFLNRRVQGVFAVDLQDLTDQSFRFSRMTHYDPAVAEYTWIAAMEGAAICFHTDAGGQIYVLSSPEMVQALENEPIIKLIREKLNVQLAEFPAAVLNSGTPAEDRELAALEHARKTLDQAVAQRGFRMMLEMVVDMLSGALRSDAPADEIGKMEELQDDLECLIGKHWIQTPAKGLSNHEEARFRTLLAKKIATQGFRPLMELIHTLVEGTQGQPDAVDPEPWTMDLQATLRAWVSTHIPQLKRV